MCGANSKQLATAVSQYTIDNKEKFPSYYNTGLEAHASDGTSILNDKTPTTPVQAFDWISPAMGDAMRFSSNRAERYLNIFNDLACASAKLTYNQFFPNAGGAPDRPEFDAAQGVRLYRQSSYIQPFGFATISHRAPNYLRTFRRPSGMTVTFSDFPGEGIDAFPSPVVVEKDYTPKLDRVGTQLSNKAMFLDGTRFYSYQLRLLDFDVQPRTLFGSFADSPNFSQSKTYGIAHPDANRQDTHLKLSFRHNGGANVAFFDSSVRFLKKEVIWERVDYFYPSGSAMSPANASPGALQRFPAGTVLP